MMTTTVNACPVCGQPPAHPVRLNYVRCDRCSHVYPTTEKDTTAMPTTNDDTTQEGAR